MSIADTYGGVDGGFTTVDELYSELGVSEAEVTRDQAAEMVRENNRQRDDMKAGDLSRFDRITRDDDTIREARQAREAAESRARHEAAAAIRARDEATRERKAREAAERAAAERANSLASSSRSGYSDLERASFLSTQSKLRDALEVEKMKGLLSWRSPSKLDDYLLKERLKQDVKDELLAEKRREKQQRELANLWAPERKPRTKSKPRAKSRSRAKSKPKPKSKARAKK